MKRRQFIAGLGGAAVWTVAVRAQQSPIPVIGFLHAGSSEPYALQAMAFRRGLRETGFGEGGNVAIEYRWADGQYDALPRLIADLVNRRVAIIVAGGPPAAQAAKAATTTIPIVFIGGDDPVRAGLVASLNRPGDRITGVSTFTGVLGAKQFGLLREFLPNAKVVGLLVNPGNPLSQDELEDVKAAATASGCRIEVANARSEAELEKAFASLAERSVEALIVGADPFMFARRQMVVALAMRHSLPAIFELREFATAGGLISYGASLAESYRQVGIYTGRILKGEKPANLPVMQPTTFELVINLKTAKALGLTIPETLLATADEVIQ
jgi:putative tryptophan/tyrosine transport system substrate-binding protein